MHRRALLKSLAVAAFIPADTWARIASGARGDLTPEQLEHIGAIADVIIPRTDTPSATDVDVPAFVSIIVTENYTDAERSAFLANLDSIDPHGLDALESWGDRRAEPARTYWRLKGLIIHGYFTSERVMKDVLHYEVMPGKFDGNVRHA